MSRTDQNELLILFFLVRTKTSNGYICACIIQVVCYAQAAMLTLFNCMYSSFTVVLFHHRYCDSPRAESSQAASKPGRVTLRVLYLLISITGHTVNRWLFVHAKT